MSSPKDSGAPPGSGAKTTFALLELTDVHSTVLSYDYYKLAQDKTIGLERASTLVKQARQEFGNSILVDNGDTIQGTVLSDVQALIQPVPCGDALAVFKAMSAVGVEVGGIGNHEFNYGLGFLSQVTHQPFDVDGIDAGANAGCKGPAFPQVLSNVFSVKTNQPIFQPSTILEKTVSVVNPDGQTVQAKIKIGFLAFTPPPILNWDSRWLKDKVYTKGVQEVAPAIVQDLRNKGADLVVAIIHGGISAYVDTSKTPAANVPVPYTPGLESPSYYLAQVPGIDAMLMGHSHLVFPSATASSTGFNVPGVDKVHGTVNGVPSVMANFWGQHLGVIKLGLAFDGTHWGVDKTQTVVEARPIATTCTGGKAVVCDASGKWATGGPCSFASACSGQPDKTKVFVDADPAIAPLVDAEHQATITYVKTPIGKSDFEMASYFAELGDPGAIQIVNQAQTDYVSKYVQANLPQYANLPVLSVSAPFKSGFAGATDYTDVAKGDMAINNAADLYLYPNTVYAVKVSGQILQNWLEAAATRFNTIDPTKTTDQELINSAQPGYNFDTFTTLDIHYEIDVTQKPMSRIKNLTYMGQAITPNQQFIVATNNYRATGGGNFPGLDGSNVIYASPDANRDVLIKYIKGLGSVTKKDNGSARSWSFTKVQTTGHVVFHATPGKLDLAKADGVTNVTVLTPDDGSGKSIYAVDLNQ